jgi:hypothetical protein
MRTTKLFGWRLLAWRGLAGLLLGWCVQGASAQPVTFQGKLENGGLPVTGSYDMRFQAMTALTGGSPVGSPVAADGVSVSNGLFTAPLFFGSSVFTGADVFVQVSVRPAGSGSFTDLSPRQQVTPAPYAIKALNESWHSAGGILSNDTSTFKVVINSASPFLGNDYFEVNVPSFQTGPAGMSVNAQNPGGEASYGYAVAGSSRGYTAFGAANSTWRLFLDGADRMTVSSFTGNVGVGTVLAPTERLEVSGNVKASAFRYAFTQARTLAVPPDAFHPAFFTDAGVFGGGLAFLGVPSGSIVAPIYLPDGATITGMTLTFVDNSSADLTASVLSRPMTATGFIQAATVATSGASPSVRTVSAAGSLVVDNTNSCLSVSINSTGWNSSTLFIRGVQVQYTVGSAD